jgi:hypothetical protein
MTTAEQILAFNDRQPVPIEEWGQKLQIVPMSGVDLDSYHVERHRAKEAGQDNMHNWRAKFLVRCIYDLQGNRVFSDEQAEQLGHKHGKTLQRLFDIAEAVNKTGPGAVEAEAKNS